MALCMGGIGQVGASSRWTSPLAIIGYFLGAAMLVIIISAFIGWKLQQDLQTMDRQIADHRSLTNSETQKAEYLNLMNLEEYMNPYTREPETGSNHMNDLSEQASHLIVSQLDALSRVAVDRQYALQSDLWKPYNQIGVTKSLRDTGYHFSYLAESLTAKDSSLFLDYVGWVKVLFAGLNFSPAVLTTTLACMNQALQETLPPDLAAVSCNYIDAALNHLPHIPETLESFIAPESPQFQLATNYLNALLLGDRHGGSQLILDAADHGVSVKDIYLNVFQPSQQEIGRLWQMNRVSVAQEHFCTGATQMIMSQLYPRIFSTQKNGHRLVATSVGGELHEIGVRMVTDFLEMEGWDTYYLGANSPPESILRTIEERQADVVAISATISFHVSKVTELINRIRTSSKNSSVKIMVGGYPFNVSSGLWQQVGADGYARNAQDAVSVANNLVKQVQ